VPRPRRAAEHHSGAGGRLQILQKLATFVIFYEQNHLYRTIPLDGRAPLDPNIRKAMGVSRGHWDGNVLVVEVTTSPNNLSNNWVIGAISATPGVPAESLTTGHGIPHSDLYRVTERYTPIDANTIHYEARIEDPKVFTQPWTIAYHAFARAAEELRAGRIRVLRRKRQEPAADD